MLIGLTGENGSGKGTMAKYLSRKGFYYLSLSDEIRKALATEGKEITRWSLTEKAIELRKKFGPGILAKRVLLKVKGDRNYVIDSIRTPAEVKELKKREGFFLVYVTSSPRIRFKRMKARSREGDPRTFKEFVRVEKSYLRNSDMSKQQVLKTSHMADKRLVNDSDLRSFYKKIDATLGELAKAFKPSKPDWDEYFMGIAKAVATRSSCIKRHSGAVIAKDKRIISTGYNGTPRGIRNCNEGGCPRCNSFSDSGKNLEECFCSHWEENAIVQAAYHGISIKGATLYTTFSPCLLCTKMIITGGISEVVYNSEYPLSKTSLRLLKEAGVVLKQVKVD